MLLSTCIVRWAAAGNKPLSLTEFIRRGYEIGSGMLLKAAAY